uniref:Dynactin subunit 3 n=1 Tax=Bracon brevicornis TaxID=1563983 RepID=A0A6V7LC00_9HYME
MASIDTLEDRLAELEGIVYGNSKKPSIDDPLPESSVIDTVINANTMISSALSSREKTNALVKRLPELNDYLEMKFENEELQSGAKWEMIQIMDMDIREKLKSMEKMKELLPALDVDLLKSIPELSPKLEKLTIDYLNAYDEASADSVKLQQIFGKYNIIMDGITRAMINLYEAVGDAERAAAPKKPLD